VEKTEQEKREEYIEWSFRSDFDCHPQKTYLNKSHSDWSSKEVYEHIRRWNEVTDLQFTVSNIDVKLSRFKSLNAPESMIGEILSQKSERISELESMLKSPPHRSSIRFVMVRLLDKKRLEEHRIKGIGGGPETLFVLLENLSQVYIRAGVPVPTHLVMPEKSFHRPKGKRK
jgi:hypothetical protein